MEAQVQNSERERNEKDQRASTAARAVTPVVPRADLPLPRRPGVVAGRAVPAAQSRRAQVGPAAPGGGGGGAPRRGERYVCDRLRVWGEIAVVPERDGAAGGDDWVKRPLSDEREGTFDPIGIWNI
jgi:hypothetical protein